MNSFYGAVKPEQIYLLTYRSYILRMPLSHLRTTFLSGMLTWNRLAVELHFVVIYFFTLYWSFDRFHENGKPYTLYFNYTDKIL